MFILPYFWSCKIKYATYHQQAACICRKYGKIEQAEYCYKQARLAMGIEE